MLIAPLLHGFEVVNVCLTKLRRNPEARATILAAFVLQGGVTIEAAHVDHAATLVLAEQFRLTG